MLLDFPYMPAAPPKLPPEAPNKALIWFCSDVIWFWMFCTFCCAASNAACSRSTRAAAHLLAVVSLLRLAHCLLCRAKRGLHLSKLLGQLLHLGVVAWASTAARRITHGCLRIVGERLAEGGVCTRLTYVVDRAQVGVDHRQTTTIVQVALSPFSAPMYWFACPIA